jgi:hypothetical protein
VRALDPALDGLDRRERLWRFNKFPGSRANPDDKELIEAVEKAVQ